MLLAKKPPKQMKNKGEIQLDRNAYQREYHHKNKDYLNEMERTRHYRMKYPEILTDAFYNDWGSVSGDVLKCWLEFKPIIQSHPELKEHLCKFLADMTDKETANPTPKIENI
jgi:hypothetical protein